MPTATITSKGQVTIPVAVRREMDLQPGSKIEFIPDVDGTWRVVKRKRSIMELAGVIEWTGDPVPIEEMNESIKLHVGKHYLEGLDD